MSCDTLSNNLRYFIEHQDELVQKYNGQVLVIKDQEVVGTYSSEIEAYIEAQKKYELGTFSIQRCNPGPEAYTVTISSTEISL